MSVLCACGEDLDNWRGSLQTVTPGQGDGSGLMPETLFIARPEWTKARHKM